MVLSGIFGTLPPLDCKTFTKQHCTIESIISRRGRGDEEDGENVEEDNEDNGENEDKENKKKEEDEDEENGRTRSMKTRGENWENEE